MKTPPLPPFNFPLAGLLVLLAAIGGGCSTTSSPRLARLEPTPVVTEDPRLQEALGQLDAFLDKNPAIEHELQQSRKLGNDLTLRQAFPEWQRLTGDQPAIPDGLKIESRFLLHRALVRMAGNTRLETRNLLRLDRFLDDHSDIQDALEAEPALLLSVDFHLKHPQLAEFLESHPDLSSAFYQTAEKLAVQ